MRYQPTVFGQLLKAVPRRRFDRLAVVHGSGRRKRVLSPFAHCVSMVLAQLSGASSLRDLERMLERQRGAFDHLGLKEVRRSTLADANRDRPAALFEALAADLASRLGRGRREALRLIDATRIHAGKSLQGWTSGGGVKLHLIFDPVEERPVRFVVTPERVNDIVAARAMPIEPGATYVFDKGYYAFAFFKRLDDLGCRFVTRLKKNSPIRPIESRDAIGANILGDRIGLLSARLSGQRHNPYHRPVRLVEARIEGGRTLTLITNDLAAPAEEIAALYKTRWQIELFFKWIKQNLKIRRFLGTTENAVRIQIMAALIAYLLLRIAATTRAAALSLQASARLAVHTILARRPLDDILHPPPKPQPKHASQMSFAI